MYCMFDGLCVRQVILWQIAPRTKTIPDELFFLNIVDTNLTFFLITVKYINVWS